MALCNKAELLKSSTIKVSVKCVITCARRSILDFTDTVFAQKAITYEYWIALVWVSFSMKCTETDEKKNTLPAVKPWATRIRFPSAAPKSLIKRIELAIPLYLLRNSIKLHRRLNNITLQYLFCLELQYKYHPCLPMFSFLFILGSLSNDDGDA